MSSRLELPPRSYALSQQGGFYLYLFCLFETGSHCVAPAGLELRSACQQDDLKKVEGIAVKFSHLSVY